MIIKCPKCNAIPKANDINLQNGSAICRICDAGFSFKENALDAKTKVPIDVSKIKLITRNERAGFLIEYSWRNWGEAFFLGLFSIIWNGIVFFGVLMNFDSLIEEIKQEPLILVFSLHPMIGLVVTYIFLAKIFNKTKIMIEANCIHVSLGPVWWPGSKRVTTQGISQFYVERYVAYRQNHGNVFKFQIKFISSGVHEVLLKGIGDINTARRIEELLEEKLSIQDQVVAEEYKAG